MSQEGKKFNRKQFGFTGEWNPTDDPLVIGEENYSELENYRYRRRRGGLEAVQGYSKINNLPIVLPWEDQTTPGTTNWRDVCWSPELLLFCAVGYFGDNRVMTSPNGATWTVRTNGVGSNAWRSVCWSPELSLFCAVSETGTQTRAMTSPDGINWTIRATPVDNDWQAVCWSVSASVFVAVADNGTPQRVMTSVDGSTWLMRDSAGGLSNGWSDIVSKDVGEGSLIVAISWNGGTQQVMTSTTGVSWTLQTTNLDRQWNGICFSEELDMFVIVGNGLGQLLTSSNGADWTPQTCPTNGFGGVAWSPKLGVFAAVAYSKEGEPSGRRAMLSLDGINWYSSSGISAVGWWGVCWSPELSMFCAVAYSGTDRVMTAYLTTSYNKGRSAIQLISPHTQKTRVLVQALDGAGEAGVVENLTDIPDQGEFEGDVLQVDDPDAGLGRFSKWPGGSIAYCNEKESKVYAGDEKECDAFLTSTAVVDHEVTDAIDYTEAVKNTLDDAENVALVGGGVDSYTKLLLHCDGDDESTTFDDDGSTGHSPVAQGTAQLDTAQSKFGPSSGWFDGNSDYVIVPDHADWYMGTGRVCVDLRIRFQSLPGNGQYKGIFGQYEDANNYVSFYQTCTIVGAFTFRYLVFDIMDGGSLTRMSLWSNIQVNQWMHVALIRGWDPYLGVGDPDDTWVITVNGTGAFGPPGEFTYAGEWPDFTAVDFEVGRGYAGGAMRYHHGWIDEKRVSKGHNRWSESFTPPTKAYGTSALFGIIGSTRPLQGGKFYVSNPNAETSTITFKEWNGNSWSLLEITDNTSSGGVTLAQTGTITWEHTADSARVKLLEKRLLYWYQFEISAGGAEIYHVTFDAGWQDVCDIWDGLMRVMGQFRFEKASFVYDATLDVNIETPAGVAAADSYTADLGALAVGEWFEVGTEERMCSIYIKMFEGESGQVNTVGSTLFRVDYWTGEDWKVASGFFDGTSDTSVTLAKSGHMSWDPPGESEEQMQNKYGKRLYYYRFTLSGFALSTTVLVDFVQGVPAPNPPRPVYKFPFMFRGRPMLCAATGQKEGNRVDFGITGSTEGFNGFDSSFGIGALYFGGSEDLSCAIELYNRFSANIYAMGIFCKDNETYLLTGYDADTYTIRKISGTVGCPAPLTMDSVEINYGLTEGVIRNVAGWLSYSGPYLCDGGVMEPIEGNIACYFDKSDPRCINFDAIENCRGWMDPDNLSYNLGLCSGSGQTEINVWVAFDLILKRWYHIKPAGTADIYPNAAVRVVDENGAQYVYGFLDNGHMMHLENGPDWDGEDMAQKVTFADQIPTNDIWDFVTTRYFKLLCESISEAVNVTVKHYKDGEAAGTDLRPVAANGANRYVRNSQKYEAKGFSHKFEIEAVTSTTVKGIPLLAWGYQYEKVREDV